ncbi:MAG: D-glycero-beta-D-manno-heptose 1-phosphate adenylyltransferase [Ignavibacteriae bacterium]|nr:MAG: D-glycero-beta-D-manno-heptose 1-phosphate adenylyltransferase [Ignavibacteriota bacterium]
MKNSLKNLSEIIEIKNKLKSENKKIVFTNGCFDIIHAGHVDYLIKAKKQGDVLIVGLNSDDSIRRLKGESRPIVPQTERAFILNNLKPVDYVVLFEEETPINLIEKIVPDILIKGGDWKIDNIVGKDVVEKSGGVVKTIEFVTAQSTTNIIQKVIDTHNERKN